MDSHDRAFEKLRELPDGHVPINSSALDRSIPPAALPDPVRRRKIRRVAQAPRRVKT